MDSVKQKQVNDILLKPICCKKIYKEIILAPEGDKILTGQQYYCAADEDMSDFTIGFYERIYKDILSNNPILDIDGYVINKQFSGDTMNSFNTLANKILNDANKKHRSPKNEWPPILKKYNDNCHCLANFWLIPMDIGRSSKKLNYYDSTDLFMNKLEREYDNLAKKYAVYFSNIKDYEDYCDKHFISIVTPESEVLEMYKDSNAGELIINNALKDIEARALAISKSKYSSDLWEYFNSLNLFDMENDNGSLEPCLGI